jgi:hypothetical protein
MGFLSCCRPSAWNLDIDDVFAYSSAKRVRIRDHRLGLLYYLFLLGVVAYIGVYTLAYNLAYLQFAEPEGMVTFSLQAPTVGGCNPSKPSCRDKFTDSTQLKYCCQPNCTADPLEHGACKCGFSPTKNLECIFVDGETASQEFRSSIFIETRRSASRETRNASCGATSTQCDHLWIVDSTTSSYVNSLDQFTLSVDHIAVVPREFYKKSRDIQGFLYVATQDDSIRQNELCKSRNGVVDPYSDVLKPTAPCYIKPTEADASYKLDIFTIDELITAGGTLFGLDEPAASETKSIRYAGMRLIMSVYYMNTRPWRGITDTRYYYVASAMTKSSYGLKTVQDDPVVPGQPQTRTSLHRHGILVQANVDGKIGSFFFNNLIVQLAASAAMLSVAVVVVDILATNFLKYRQYYSHHMFEDTPDFSDVEQLSQLTTEELRHQCREQGLPTAGEHHVLVVRLLHARELAASDRTTSQDGRSRELLAPGSEVDYRDMSA